MGGTISVESEYGKGTTIYLSIPKTIGDEALVYQIADDGLTISAPDAKILVVDDNTINLNVACGLLQLCNINAQTAESGMQAIEMIRLAEANQNQYDLIFMDHMMPEMDGVETTKNIREDGVTIPIIALTANAIMGIKNEFLAAGMNDLLTKPINKALLNKILKDWLPAEKVTEISNETPAEDKPLTETNTEFWKKIEQIEGLSIQTGLERISGQRDVYEKSLQLTIKEIEKCDKNLRLFLADNDMHSFSIEVHSMKGSLANIGVMELSVLAQELEDAADKEDSSFCIEKLPQFLEDLIKLRDGLTGAFSEKSLFQSPLKITPEMSSMLKVIFDKLVIAFDEPDFIAINQSMEELNSINPGGALQEELEKIKDAVLVMDYDNANETMQDLLK
jgi:CheY-like chemotaxis protein